jgi:hypothetical protein
LKLGYHSNEKTSQMAIERITVTGIVPTGDSIRPEGHHLRWAFPAQLGFPAKGFSIYRRLSGGFKLDRCLSFSKIPVGQIVASGSSPEGVSFHYPGPTQIQGNGQNLSVHLPRPNLLELRFPEPIACVRINIGDIQGPVQLRAYAGSQQVATSSTFSSNEHLLEVTAPYVTRVTIPLNFKLLNEVCFLSMDAACQAKGWEKSIIELPLLASVDKALDRLEVDLSNRYAANRELAVQRYEPELEALIKWLNLLQKPSSDAFANPGVSPDQLQLPAPPEANSPLPCIRPQAMLLLAALDPNIARFLSLYWVDQYVAGKDPQPGERYDYKVEGQWKDAVVGCGLLFGLGAKEASLPSLDTPLEGDQLPGLRWQGKDPCGRVGLRWPRPQSSQGAVQPVLFDLWRTSLGRPEVFLTETLPVLVPAKAWETDATALFIDTDVPLDQHSYRLQAIDLFGQVGEPIKSKLINVADLVAPPPPIRLRATLTQPGYPWRTREQRDHATELARLILQFEYGDAQHSQAPDAKEFRVYWCPESMFETRSVAIQRVSSPGLEDNSVRVHDGAKFDLTAFEGGKLSRESATATPLPAAERHHYQIAKVLSADQLQLAPSGRQFVYGAYRLISDPHLRSNWAMLDFRIPVRQPLQGVVQIAASFQAVATKVEQLSPRSDPVALMPANHRPAQLDEPPPIVEVELDRRLLETDLFARGTVKVDGQSPPIDILYSTSGAASPARIGLPPGTRVSVGAVLTLSPAQPLVQALTIQGAVPAGFAQTPGGEIAFDSTQDKQLVTYVGRVVSDIRAGSGVFNLLVSLSPAARRALRSGITTCRYYAPYRQELNVRLPITLGNSNSATTIVLPMAGGQSSQHLYLAVTTDDGLLNESPLSSPAQVTAVKPPPTGAPSQPYPCGQDAAAEAGYATPPDRQGRATLCLAWDAGTLSSTAGIRYEVARTLDNTILATHRRNWLLGGPSLAVAPSAAVAPSVSGTLSGAPFDETRGLYQVTLTANLGGVEPAAFRGGRLAQNGGFFQITLIAAEAGTLQLMVRPMVNNVPTNGAATIERPPDYDAAVRDDLLDLRQLAAANPDAFGLVTGVPIPNASAPNKETQFRDEIPGIGRNRFFYRVRAVDAAENRSAWSAVSAPFYQVDTTPPEAPRELQVFPGDRIAVLTWLTSRDPQITGYRVYRTEGGEDEFSPLNAVVHAEISRRLIAIDGSLALPQPLEFTVESGLSVTDIAARIGAQIKVQELTAVANTSNLFDAATSRAIFDTSDNGDGTSTVHVRALSGLMSSGAGMPLKVIFGQRVIDGDSSVQTWTDAGLSGGVRYGYRVAAVKTVRAASESPSQPFRELVIVGPESIPAAIMGLDRSVPPAPVVVATEWVDLDGNVMTDTAPDVRLRLTIQAPAGTARILVQRRGADDAPWTTPSVNGRRGWQDWPNGAGQAQLVDATAKSDKVWIYRVQIRTTDGRSSEPADTQLTN